MGGKGAGFASMSRKKLTEVSSKGGKNANKKGLKVQWTSESAKKAGALGLLKRKQRMAAEAALRLVNLGFDPDVLNSLKLTHDEYIYFGGKMAKPKQRDELQARIDALKNG